MWTYGALKASSANFTGFIESTSLSSWISGCCLINPEEERQTYFDTKLSMAPDLCSDFLFGQYFMGVTFEYLKTEVKNTIVYSIDEKLITIDTDTSNNTVAALNQFGRLSFLFKNFKYQQMKALFYRKISPSNSRGFI